jgi:hypothetical protein
MPRGEVVTVSPPSSHHDPGVVKVLFAGRFRLPPDRVNSVTKERGCTRTDKLLVQPGHAL